MRVDHRPARGAEAEELKHCRFGVKPASACSLSSTAPSNAILRRLLTDQGSKHWKGYALRFRDDGPDRAHHLAVRLDHRQDRQRGFRRAQPCGGVGNHGGDRDHLHGQGPCDLRTAGRPFAGRQQHCRRRPEAHVRPDAADEGQLLRPVAFVDLHRPSGLHRPIGEQRAQPSHHDIFSRRTDDRRARHRHGVAGSSAFVPGADVGSARRVRRAQDRRPRAHRSWRASSRAPYR